MKQILPKLREVEKYLKFMRKAFTKRGFRHAISFISGLITINKKSVKQISRASIHETHHSSISRILNEAKFEKEYIINRYIKKIKYFMKGQVTLIIDDTLSKREGEKIAQTQSHYDHTTGGHTQGHQFFTALIHCRGITLPIFPELYSKDTKTKIEMTKNLIDFLLEQKVPITRFLCDSWYSDHKIINKCLAKGIEVICAVKTNRKISLKRGTWTSLKKFSLKCKDNEFNNFMIDEHTYQIADYSTKLKSIPRVKLLISKEFNFKLKRWIDPFHIICTNRRKSNVYIIRTYALRWLIETFHRDMKQHLGFASNYARNREAIVRHSICSTLAYIALKLFMYQRNLNWTIGECIAYIQNTEMDNFIYEIVSIEDKEQRLKRFEEVFIRKTAKV